MRTVPVSSPAIVEAVAGYQRQRAVFVQQIAAISNTSVDYIAPRCAVLRAEIERIDKAIHGLCFNTISAD